MKFILKLKYSHRLVLGGGIFSVLFIFCFFAFAAYPATPYSPGETLNPACAPGDANCMVALTSGSVLFSDGVNLITQDNANLFWASSTKRLGIGTTSPTQKLDVAGTVNATAFTGDGSGLTGISGTISGLNAGYLSKAATSSSINDSAVFQSGTNIGIGTTSPQTKLDVWGNTRSTDSNGHYIQFSKVMGGEGVITTDESNFSFQPASGYVYVYKSGVNNVFGVYGSSGGSNWIKLTHDNSNGTISTGVGNLILNPATDNVGIGTTTPSYKLTINSATTTENLFQIATTTNQGIFVVNSSGNVGIGTTTPAVSLQVGNGTPVTSGSNNAYITGTLEMGGDMRASANTFYWAGTQKIGQFIGKGLRTISGKTLSFGDSDSFAIGYQDVSHNYLQFMTGNTIGTNVKMVIDSSGNVGIGTMTPSAKLDILNSSTTNGLTIDASTTLQQATGNEVAYRLNYTINKLTSGADTGLEIDKTDINSPDQSYGLIINRNSSPIFWVKTNISTPNVWSKGDYTMDGWGIVSAVINQTLKVDYGRTISNATYANVVSIAEDTLTNTSGQKNIVAITPTYNQTSGTASNTDLLINRTQTAVGTGAQLLIDAQVGGTSKFNVTNTGQGYFSGNVGIGTTTPGAKLELGSGQIFAPDGTSATPSYSFSNDSTTGFARSSSGIVQYISSGGPKFSFHSGGILGLGGAGAPDIRFYQNYGPTAPAYTFSGDVNTGLYSPAADTLSLTTAGTDRLWINSSGNIGIGTTTPSYKLTINSATTTENLFQIATTTNQGIFVVNSSGNVGIGTTTPAYLLTMGTGGGYYNQGTGAWVAGSDRAYKTNIEDMTKYGLNTVMSLRPVSYIMKESGIEQIGFVAQDILPIIPELVSGQNGSMGLNYGGFAPVFVKAIQEQQKQIDNLKLNIDELNTQIVNSTSAVFSGKSIFDSVLSWLEDKVVKAREFIADKITTKKVCIDGGDGEAVCIDKNQLKQLLERNSAPAPLPFTTPALEATLTPTPTPIPIINNSSLIIESTPTPELIIYH